jgi:GMP synthase (glutamine-hydrolysing)
MIKSHHNVGGLPKDLKFQLIEPLRELFKVPLPLGASLPISNPIAMTHPLNSFSRPAPGFSIQHSTRFWPA